MSDAQAANARAREARARDHAERVARIRAGLAKPTAPNRAAVQHHAGGMSVPPVRPERRATNDPDHPDSAEGVLARARAAGIQGLRKPKANAEADVPPPDDDDPDSAEAVLARARAAGVVGLRKR